MNGNGFGADNMGMANLLLSQQVQQRNQGQLGPPPGQAQPQQQDAWQPLMQALFGQAGGGDPEDAADRQEQFHTGMDQLGDAFASMGSGPILPLPKPYTGPGTTLGQNQGQGLQQLIQQILRGA